MMQYEINVDRYSVRSFKVAMELRTRHDRNAVATGAEPH